ncbi:MAG: Protease 3 [Chlamydiae bacterium]|nr:Protease 3 [Chlamydiota bacterium]
MRKWTCLFFLCVMIHLQATEDSYDTVTDLSELSILSPSLSERKTAKLRLSNGLEVYLISDPVVEQSAAALAVEAGSWYDPDEYPGMAHFLEHMLFMGTAAYPKEFEYMQYVSDNGGKVNAYTASDRTVYMFSVNNEGFTGALDRFSHFFYDPLFLPSCIDRELHAVDQEHAKNVEHDGWRQYMIFKETGNPDHPIAKFSTGNADTLRGIPQDVMKAWYTEHYDSERMHLVILSALPLDELIDLTVADFSRIQKANFKPAEMPEVLTSEKQRGHYIYVKPIKDLKSLSLTWELSKESALDKTFQTGALIAYTLQNGGKNSLLGQLKREHLASGISVSEEQFSKGWKLFTIDVELSDEGVKNVDQVITYCYEALARLKKNGIPKYLYDEMEKIATMKYEYQSREDAFEFIKDQAHKMVDEELATYPKQTLLPGEYNPKVIGNYLQSLTPETCIYFVTAAPQKSGIQPTEREQWMGAEYSIRPVSEERLASWSHAKINPKIGLPQPNPFIPKNLDLINTPDTNQTVTPTLLQDNEEGKIYFASDLKYQVPEVTYIFRIKSPKLNGTAKAQALTDIYLKSLSDHLFPTISSAETAGSRVVLSQGNYALTIGINGYSDQSDRLVKDLFTGIKKMRPSRKQFSLYKQSVSETYDNASKELPIIQSLELLNNIIFNDSPLAKEKRTALTSITYEEFVSFTKDLWKKSYSEGLLYGNITEKEASSLWKQVKNRLASSPFSPEEHYKKEFLVLPENQGPYMILQTTKMQGSAALLMVEQGAYDYNTRAGQQVLGLLLKHAFFNTLRTKQQTAYIARAWEKEAERQLFQLFAVQSITHQPSELVARFELFLEDFVKQFTERVPKERFENIRSMAITSLEMPPENLLLMGTRLFLLAFDYDGAFELINHRIAALKELTYEELHARAAEYFSRKNSRRLAILVEGTMPKDRNFRYDVVTKEELKDSGTFVAWK